MIAFDSKDPYYKKPFGAVPLYTTISLKVNAKVYSDTDEVYLVVSMAMDDQVNTTYKGAFENSRNHIHSFLFHWPCMKTGLYFYHFEVVSFGKVIDQSDLFQLTVYAEDFTVPEWLKDGVMYQIFPDRFSRSKFYHGPKQEKNYILREDWGGLPHSLPDKNGRIQNNDFFGGNLLGIIEKLDYLRNLGITVLYLNPIFQSYSNHRYDTGDFKKIDPMLGTEDDFIDLCREAKERGIRVILDGVFNHTGSDSLYFNKEGRYPEVGAFQSKESTYYPWFKFIDYPHVYESWWGIDTLPSVNETDQGYLDYILTGEDSVVKHWLRCGASGFRLDVADELPDGFLDLLRITVKEISPDAVIIGEVWEDASNKSSYGHRRRYLQGAQLDSVMNYPLKDAIIRFLSHHSDAAALADVVNSIWENYPEPAYYSLMNILGTHDTKRIFTALSKEGERYETIRQRLFLALLLYSFMPGIPCVYYGDEIGMMGKKDPFNRGCFDFQARRQDIYSYYKRLFAFKDKIKKLSAMKFQPGIADERFYSYQRIGEKQRLVVAVNTGTGDYTLDLALEEERVKDILISGSVFLEGPDRFRIMPGSGIVIYIATT